MIDTSYIDRQIEQLQVQKLLLENKETYRKKLVEFFNGQVGKCYRVSQGISGCNDTQVEFVKIDSYHLCEVSNKEYLYEVSLRGAQCNIYYSPCMTIGRTRFDQKFIYRDSYSYINSGENRFKISTERGYDTTVAGSFAYVNFKKLKSKAKELEGQSPHTYAHDNHTFSCNFKIDEEPKLKYHSYRFIEISLSEFYHAWDTCILSQDIVIERMAYLIEDQVPGTFVTYSYNSIENRNRVRSVITRLEDWLTKYPKWQDVPEDVIKRIINIKE